MVTSCFVVVIVVCNIQDPVEHNKDLSNCSVCPLRRFPVTGMEIWP